MRERVVNVLFHEPQGQKMGLLAIAVGMSTLFFSYINFITGDTSFGVLRVFLGLGLILLGIAESLPSQRKRLIGAFRVLALLIAGLALVDLGLILLSFVFS